MPNCHWFLSLSIDRAVSLHVQTGRIVVAARQFNWTLQEAFMNYTVLIPNVVDLSQYLAALRDLTQVVQGIATGQPPWTSPGAPCNQPVPAVKKCAPSPAYLA